MLQQLGHLPKLGEHFDYEGWRFEVVDLDGRRIDKVLAIPPKGRRKLWIHANFRFERLDLRGEGTRKLVEGLPRR